MTLSVRASEFRIALAAARDPRTGTRLAFEYSIIDYRHRAYDRFYPRRSPSSGPGWCVFGRNRQYGDSLIRLCARPRVVPRAHPHYNVMVRRGWPTQRAAHAVAQWLNARYPTGQPGVPKRCR